MITMSKSTHPVPAVLFLLLVFCSATAYGAPKARLWSRWQANDPHSHVIVDHTAWDRLLQRYVDSHHPSGINRFAYSRVSPQDRQALKDYLRKMQKIKVSGLNRKEQEAYWINLYNSLTVEVILEHYPVRSIRDIDISPGFFSNGPWDAKLLKIEGVDVTLNDIEHRILRPIWRDNRIHYALNCASLGCPNLQPRAFTAANLDMLLGKGAREFINSPRGVSFAGNRLRLSSIYKWFEEDFGGSAAGIILHLKKYLNPEKLKKLAAVQKKMTFHYNWDLNE